MAFPSAALSPRGAVTLRVAVALVGGYGLANLTVLACRLLPLAGQDGARLGAMLAFMVFALVPVWVFTIRSPARMAAGLVLPAASLVLLLWSFGGLS